MTVIEEFHKFVGEKMFSEARRLVQEILDAAPNAPLGHYLLGAMLFEQGDLIEAEAELRTSLRIDPTFARASNYLGLLLVKKHRPLEALQAFENAVKDDAKLYEARINLGTLLLGKGDYDAAALHLEKAVSIRPEDAQAHFHLAFAYASSNRLDEAEREWRETTRFAPDWPEPYSNLGMIQEKRKAWNEAEDSYREAVRRDPQSRSYRRRLRTVMASADLEVFHLTRWSRTVIELPGYPLNESVLYNGYQVPLISVQNLYQYRAIVSTLKELASRQFPILFRGQSRSWLVDANVSLTPARFRSPLGQDELVEAVEAWREVLRPYLGGLSEKPGGTFGWGDESHGTLLQVPPMEVTGNMMAMAWQPELAGTLQHYGFPTEFLDASPDPDVALWFALRQAQKDADGVIWHTPSTWSSNDPTERWPVIYVLKPLRYQVVDLTDGCLTQGASQRASRQHATLVSFLVYKEPMLDPLARVAGTDGLPPERVLHPPDLVLALRLWPDSSWQRVKLPEASWYFPEEDAIYQQLMKSNVPFVARYP